MKYHLWFLKFRKWFFTVFTILQFPVPVFMKRQIWKFSTYWQKLRDHYNFMKLTNRKANIRAHTLKFLFFSFFFSKFSFFNAKVCCWYFFAKMFIHWSFFYANLFPLVLEQLYWDWNFGYPYLSTSTIELYEQKDCHTLRSDKKNSFIEQAVFFTMKTQIK